MRKYLSSFPLNVVRNEVKQQQPLASVFHCQHRFISYMFPASFRSEKCPLSRLAVPLSSVSWLGEPRLSFLLIFPVLVSVRREAGVSYLASLVTSQWAGMVCKWILQGLNLLRKTRRSIDARCDCAWCVED